MRVVPRALRGAPMLRNHEIVPTTQARPDLLAQDPGGALLHVFRASS
jgi:hypothetical protein